jgi:hypothetical protein
MSLAQRAGQLSRPILFRLPRHGRRRRILDLDPAIVATWSIRRPKPLRNFALAAKRPGLFVDDRAIDLAMAVECDSGRGATVP